MLSNLFARVEDAKIRIAYGILRWIKRVKASCPQPTWYPIVMMLHLDEGGEPLIQRQSLIAFSEWIRYGTPSFTISVLVERSERDDTEKYLHELDTCLKTQIGESCINVHTLLVTYKDASDLSETTSAVIQCTEIGALIPNTLVVNFPQFECYSSSNRKNLNDTTLLEFWRKIVTYEKKCLVICKGELWRIKPAADVLTVDIWWIVEDDDILLLFMYLITNWRKFVDARVRLFAVIADCNSKESEAIMVEAIYERIARSLIVAELIIERVEEGAIMFYKGVRAVYTETTCQTQTIEDEGIAPPRKKSRGGCVKLNNRIREKSAQSDLVFVNVPKWSPESVPMQRKFLSHLEGLADKLNHMVMIRPPPTDFRIKK